MKKFKKLNAVITATLMAAALSVPMASSLSVSAASGDNSITIIAGNDKMTHSAVAAYQVFAGTYNDTDANLTITGWGDGIDVDAFITAIKADSTIIGASFANVTITNNAAGAQAVADIVGKWTDNSDEAKAFAKLAVANATTKSGTYADGKISGIADGYYVMADESAATATDPVGSAFTLGLLQVVGGENVEVTTKIDYPTVVKKVQEDDITTDDGYGAGFNDVADWDANTDVPFKIIATMPSNIDEYDHYYMNFTDTLDDTFGNPENIEVKAGTKTLVLDTDYTIETNGNDMNIVIMDLKGVDGLTVDEKTTVTVTYTAKLNVTGANTAIIGRDGQENKVKLEYSNNPNKTGNGSSKPDDTGETPEDKVIVFTYELDITKIDGATKAEIPNAEFKLGNDKGQWATVNESGYFTGWGDDEADATVLKSDDKGIFKVIGLDDG
ncbi:MAG: isopeptide-forming domain-containing fimbrial protein, partial [Oscillospiraceae bacterium]|nr:isopeptide-forming domain-containing fimbrial protein [Oscillospiraceae bacterium]